jgi:predicted RNase H-like HicB family nuclease
MRFLVMLEPIETGFSVQVPDLAIVTYGESIEAAKQAAAKAIQINLDAYREANQKVPERKSVLTHRGKATTKKRFLKSWGEKFLLETFYMNVFPDL